MVRLKVTLRPKKNAAINANYRSRLNMLCRELIKFNRKRYVYNNDKKNSSDQLYFSPLFCRKYEVDRDKIVFKDDINWYITCSSYATVLDLIQGFYNKNIIKLGKAEFEIMSMELSSFDKNSRVHRTKRSSYLSEEVEKDLNEVALMQ